MAVIVIEDRRKDVIVTPCADPTKDVCYSCPILYDDKVSQAARESAIVHVISAQVSQSLSIVFAVIRGGGVHGASPDLCQGIEGKDWI